MVVLRGPSIPNNVRIMSDWKKSWCWERLKAKEKRAVEEEMVRSHHWLDGHELEQTLGDIGGQGSLVCCPWGHKESDMTEWLNNNKCQIGLSLLFKDELVCFKSWPNPSSLKQHSFISHSTICPCKVSLHCSIRTQADENLHHREPYHPRAREKGIKWTGH